MGATTFSLTLDPMNDSLAGLYDCIVSNSCGTAQTRAFALNGPVPVEILQPHISGTNLTLAFATANSQSYTIQQNTHLSSTNWVVYTNIIGNGLTMKIVLPTSNSSQQFFRVSEP